MKFDTDKETDKDLAYIKRVHRFSTYKEALVQAVRNYRIQVEEFQVLKRSKK